MFKIPTKGEVHLFSSILFCFLSVLLMSAVSLNVSLLVAQTSLTLHGLQQLSDHRLLFFSLFLSNYLFALCSNGLILVVIFTRRSLHKPMYVFVAALLLNSLLCGCAIYPRLLWELLWESGSVLVTVSACACQAWVIYTAGGSAFMLLAAMAFDRYVAICRPMRYAAVVSPRAVAALLLFCWLLPAALVGSVVLLAARQPLCRSNVSRLYCDVYSLNILSCSGKAMQMTEALALFISVAIVVLPAAFVLFSYSSILYVCLCRIRGSSGKALRTCLPHLLVFLNYSACTAAELLQRRLQAADQPASSVLTSVLIIVAQSVLNPVVYGLNMSAITGYIRRLLSSRKTD